MNIFNLKKNKVGTKSFIYCRIKNIRNLGYISFLNLTDLSGDIQLKLKNNNYNYKIGDYLKVYSVLIYNKIGQKILEPISIKVLSKNYSLLPDKFHNLKYSKKIFVGKYFDIFKNSNYINLHSLKMFLIKYLRIFFYKNNFLEIETPILSYRRCNSESEQFTVINRNNGKEMFLRVSPELNLKKSLICGYKKIFEIGKNFRNESTSCKHYPEFTAIEYYVIDKDYLWSMHFTENIIKKIFEFFFNKKEIYYKNKKINLKEKFDKLSVKEAIFKYSKVIKNDSIEEYLKNINKLDLNENEKNLLKKKDKKILRYIYFDKFISKNIVKPTFILNFPTVFSPLAKEIKSGVCERYELYIFNKEIANGYTELNDYKEQLKRFNYQNKLNKKGIDYDYINALKFGLPSCTGCGIGIDRLVMILRNCCIKDTILYPEF